MHSFPVRVYYEDTDFGGVVYYANYLKFLERGRTEALRDLGIDQVAMKESGKVFVVRRVSVEFLSPARFDEMLEVRTSTAWVKRASAGLNQEIWRGSDRLIAANVTIACMALNGRPAGLPPEVRANLVQLGERP